MIIVRLTSGLGNQMYQYNFYRLMKERYPDTQVKVDISWFYVNDDHHGYELEKIFKNSLASDFDVEKATPAEVYKVTGQIPPLPLSTLAKPVNYLMGFINRKLRERSSYNKGGNYIDRVSGVNADMDVMNLDVSKDWYICGFWIEEKYYEKRIARTRRELQFTEPEDKWNKRLLEEIDSSNSVSIHVRRGDYLSDTYSSMFKCLGREYYERAVNIIREKVTAPKFFIFSDDASLIEKEFTWVEATIVNNNFGENSYRDMQLMSRCKHNIIANSTFSQWGALLNKNEGHICIYPADYLKGEDTEEKHMQNWIRC